MLLSVFGYGGCNLQRKIVIGADIVATDNNYQAFVKGDRNALIGDGLCNLLDKSDYIILDMEVPFCDDGTPIVKYGPNMKCTTNTIEGYKSINSCFYTLANNHILDYGVVGLNSTIDLLNKYKIAYSGVGINLEEASKPYIATIGDSKIGIYCCADHEFSIATTSRAGVNPFDPLNSFGHVSKLKSSADFVIILYHGGKENFRYPTPYLQKVFRKFIDCGADIVVAQHTHCIGCYEMYSGGLLLYGQGNFISDYGKNPLWDTSLLLVVGIDNGKLSYEYIPIVKKGAYVRLAEDEDKENILNDFYKRSDDICKEGYIDSIYAEEIEGEVLSYLRRLSGGYGNNIISRAINRFTDSFLLKTAYKKKYFPAILNCLECDSHREALVTYLRSQI